MVCVSALWRLLQHLLSYLGFSYLGHGLSLHSCSSKAQPLLLTLNEGYLLTAAPPDLECGVAPLGPPVPAQPPLLGCGVKEVIPCLAGDETTGSGLGEMGQRGRPDPAGFTLQKYENTVENGNAAVPGGLGAWPVLPEKESLANLRPRLPCQPHTGMHVGPQ